MGIWEYADSAKYFSLDAFSSPTCIFCKGKLEMWPNIYRDEYTFNKQWQHEGLDYEENIIKVAACPICGWWKLHSITSIDDGYNDQWEEEFVGSERYHYEQGSIGCLKELDLSDVDLPLSEVRRFLAGKYGSRFQINPRLLEETVASVFRDLGYRPKVTAYTGDQGIDIILGGPSDTSIGVQVKRYKDKIEAEQIRSFSGALLIGGYTRGIFVTTSSYQPAARRTATLSEVKGIPIELIDAEKFYDALCIVQRAKYTMNNNDELLLNLPSYNLFELR